MNSTESLRQQERRGGFEVSQRPFGGADLSEVDRILSLGGRNGRL